MGRDCPLEELTIAFEADSRGAARIFARTRTIRRRSRCLSSHEGERDHNARITVPRSFLALRTIRASQDERIFIIKLALTHHGHSVGSGDTSEPHLSPGSSASLGDMERQRSSNSMGSGSNGLDDTPQVEARDTLVTNPERQVEEREDHGVYL